MTPLFVVLALLAQVGGAALFPANLEALQSTFEADLVLRPDDGPETHLFLRPGSGSTTLRLSVPLQESADEAGASQILRSQAETRMQGMARRIGALVRVSRTNEALIYEVSGPSSETDFLVWILSEGVKPPEADRFAQLRRDVLDEVLRRQETPQGALATGIRAAAGEGGVPILGSSLALERMHAGVVQAVWARSHALDQVRVVVVGDLAAEVALASLADLRLPPTTAAATPAAGNPSAAPRMQPEIIRHWVAEAWQLERPRDARALVAVALLGDQLRDVGGDYELGAELWEVAGRWTLVISGAAYPRTQQAMRTRLRGILSEAAANLTSQGVQTHAARIRGQLLADASTPWGMARMVGQALDSGLASRSIQVVLDDLARLDAPDLTALFDELSARTPLREEIRP